MDGQAAGSEPAGRQRFRAVLREDGYLDTVAAVEAMRADDREGLRIVLKHCEPRLVAAVGAKLLAEMATEREWTAAEFRAWAARVLED